MATIKNVYDKNGDLKFIFPAPPKSDTKGRGQDKTEDSEGNTEA